MAQAEHLEESSQLASRLQEELAVVTGSEGRGVKQAPFRVLVGAGMPAVLVEVAFISNPDEEQQLGSDAYQAKVAAALARGIERYRRRARACDTGGETARPEMTPRLANTLTGVALAGLLAAVSLTAPRWAGVLRASPQPIEGEEPAAEPALRHARPRRPQAGGSPSGSSS